MGALVRKEFTVYFKNPTGWFTLCVYTLIAGVCFVFSVINNNTTSMYTFFSLYLYIANLVFVSLLSFKFFSEEKKNGTDKLWTTSPVSLYTVVLSKFVSAFCLFFFGSLVNILYALILGMFGDFDVSTFVVQYIGVLLLGAIKGVLVGMVLSFIDVLMRAAAPQRTFLGTLPGKAGFFPIDRVSGVQALPHIVLYRFSGSLFFANIRRFQEDIEGAVQPDTQAVIVDGSAIVSVDITACDRLVALNRKLRAQGVRAETDLVGRSLKAQMKYADKLGAQHTVVLGTDELSAGECTLLCMATGEKKRIPLSASSIAENL